MTGVRFQSCALPALAAALLSAFPASADEPVRVVSVVPWLPGASEVSRPAPAQDPEAEDSYLEWLARRNGSGEAPPAAAPGSAVHVDIAVDWVSSYFFRGLLQERRDIIIQNSVEVGFDVLEASTDAEPDDENADPFAPLSLTAIFGVWNSFHEAATGAVSSDEFVEHWYEADLYLGMTGGYGNWGFGAIYYVYTSPADAFATSEEIALSLSYDDSALWQDVISFSPSMTMAIETRGGADGIDTGIYLELGIAPAVEVEMFSTPVELSFPLTVGLSADEYYQDATGQDKAFGYVDLGAEFAVDLPVDERFGSWSLSGGIHWLVLGDNTQAVNMGRDNQIHARLGIAISF